LRHGDETITVYPVVYSANPRGAPIKSYDLASPMAYPAIVTRSTGDRTDGPGSPENVGRYDVLIYAAADPAIDIDSPMDWRDAQGTLRTLVATDVSTPRHVGAYGVPGVWSGSDMDGVPGVGGESGDGDGGDEAALDAALDAPIG